MSATSLEAAARTEYGEVLTRRWVADVLLDLVGYTPDQDLTALRLVDPSCGTGVFLTAAVDRLCNSLRGMTPPPDTLIDCIQGFELQEKNASVCRDLVVQRLVTHGFTPHEASRLAAHWVKAADYLLDTPVPGSLFSLDETDNIDIVVGNPPYIRIEDLPEALSSAYRAHWPTMTGRADVYIGFYERALRSLRPGGKLAFICADRWMRNSYGSALRKLVGTRFSVDAVWTMHDVDAFESEVTAYPAITVISHRSQGTAVVAEAGSDFDLGSARMLADWTTRGNSVTKQGEGFHAFRLPRWFPGDEMWPSGSPEQLALLEYLNENFPPLHCDLTRTRVGIGVATGADSVFITNDPEIVESDRLLPLALTTDTRTGHFSWGGRYLVNPWSRNGELVDLQDYPRLAAYLSANEQRLRKRHTARANPYGWYRTIDRVSPTLGQRTKLLIQDMRTSINPVLEEGGCYPHHNLYYVVSDTWDMEVLGGVLLSRVAQMFVETHCVRMRGNTLRFQAQYLKKIRVPNPNDINEETKQEFRIAFRQRDVERATAAAIRAYQLDSRQWKAALTIEQRD